MQHVINNMIILRLRNHASRKGKPRKLVGGVGLPTYATQHTILVCCVGGLPTYANTKYLQHDIPLLCRVGGLPTYTTQNTSNTTYHWCVALAFTDIHNTKYLQHDIPLLCRVGGLPTYTTQNTSNTTYHWCVVLEVYRHTPIQNTSNTTCPSCVVLEVYRHAPTHNTSNTTYHWCVVLEAYRHTQHKVPPTRHTIVLSCWRFTDIHNTTYLQHDIPLVCRVCSHLSTIVHMIHTVPQKSVESHRTKLHGFQIHWS